MISHFGRNPAAEIGNNLDRGVWEHELFGDVILEWIVFVKPQNVGCIRREILWIKLQDLSGSLGSGLEVLSIHVCFRTLEGLLCRHFWHSPYKRTNSGDIGEILYGAGELWVTLCLWTSCLVVRADSRRWDAHCGVEVRVRWEDKAWLTAGSKMPQHCFRSLQCRIHTFNQLLHTNGIVFLEPASRIAQN